MTLRYLEKIERTISLAHNLRSLASQATLPYCPALRWNSARVVNPGGFEDSLRHSWWILVISW